MGQPRREAPEQYALPAPVVIFFARFVADFTRLL